MLGKVGNGAASSVPGTAIAYLVGALGSGLAGFIGMSIAVRANTRTTVQAMQGLNPALRVAFNSGAVMGASVVGIALLGVTLMFIAFGDASIVAGFGFGASSIALFARVGGGIYTKAADVGADLVGKVEQGIPEDDPRNPATVADNVGDNVGDVAGMGADLFESYVGSIIATVALAAVGAGALSTGREELALFPLLIASLGIAASIIGTFLVRTGEGADMGRLLWSLRTGIFSAGRPRARRHRRGRAGARSGLQPLLGGRRRPRPPGRSSARPPSTTPLTNTAIPSSLPSKPPPARPRSSLAGWGWA